MKQRFARNVLALYDGTVSSKNQCISLLQSMKPIQSEVLHIPLASCYERVPSWFHIIYNYVINNPLNGFMVENSRIRQKVLSNQYDVIIGCGRKTAPLVGLLGKKSDAFRIQVHHPRCGSFLNRSCFDAIITPMHDLNRHTSIVPYKRIHPNIYPTFGSLSWVNKQALDESITEWNSISRKDVSFPDAKQLHAQNSLCVLVGGPNSFVKDFKPVREQLSQVLDQSCSRFDNIFLVGSRRTDLIHFKKLREDAIRVNGSSSVYSWHPLNNQTVDNPYKYLLATCTHFIVTPDSVGMISDACATGKPTFTTPLPNATTESKFHRFLSVMQNENYLTMVDSYNLSENLLDMSALRSMGSKPLDEANAVLDELVQDWNSS